MHGKFVLFTGFVLLVVLCSFTCYADEDDTTTHSTTTHSTTTHSTTSHSTKSSEPSKSSTKSTKKTTKKRKNNYGSSYGGYGSKYNNKGKYDDDSYEVVGNDGVDPDKDGSDFGDFGPVYDNKKSMSSSLNVWISSADDWKHKDSDSDDDDPKGYRNKRSYKKVKFPVKRIKNYRKFPIRRFPPLISIFPWVPIFYDKITYQTIIFSPTGGLYIIPPLINFFGQRFAVAQLIKWGYASLVSSGAPVGPGVDVAPLVQPVPAGGAVAGPAFDANKARFTGGVKTEFRDFKPRYSQTIEEGGEVEYQAPRGNYGAGTSYGGTRNQQVVAQGGY